MLLYYHTVYRTASVKPQIIDHCLVFQMCKTVDYRQNLSDDNTEKLGRKEALTYHTRQEDTEEEA